MSVLEHPQLAFESWCNGSSGPFVSIDIKGGEEPFAAAR
jgi:hypothetical protein